MSLFFSRLFLDLVFGYMICLFELCLEGSGTLLSTFNDMCLCLKFR
jgi:hypothetical protein